MEIISNQVLARHFKPTASGMLIVEHLREVLESSKGKFEYEVAEYYLLRSDGYYYLAEDNFRRSSQWAGVPQQIETHLQRLELKQAQDEAIAKMAELRRQHVAGCQRVGAEPDPMKAKNY